MSRRITAFAIALTAAAISNAPDLLAQSCKQRVDPTRCEHEVTAYYSVRLQAWFQLQPMVFDGCKFWGARVLELEHHSPLAEKGICVGDIVTRLDGIRVSTGRQQDFDARTRSYYWSFPEMERHYGPTKVRFVKHSCRSVHELPIDLGRLETAGIAPHVGLVP